MDKNFKALVFNIQKYSIHDGSGIRTLIFLKGCPLKCLWCSNPESQKSLPEIVFSKEKCINCESCFTNCPVNAVFEDHRDNINIDSQKCTLCGKCIETCYAEALTQIGVEYNISDLMREIRKDIPFYKNSGGGITFSGGEPLLYPEFINEVAEECKKISLPVAIETCGFVPDRNLDTIMKNDNIDTIMYDIKLMDAEKHKTYCGTDNKIILENFKQLNSCKNKIIIARIPIIPGYNDDEDNIKRTAEFIKEYGKNVRRIEILPYHNFGVGKYKKLGIDYTLKKIKSPRKEKLYKIKESIEKSSGIIVQIGGQFI